MYNKIFTKILDSSIWLENQPTRIVWITFIACMDQDGVVALSSIGNVANRARVSVEEAEAAIKCLESPDIHNPDQDQEGRRIERIPGVGWIVLNSKKYRDIVKAETARLQTRERTREWRAKQKSEDGDADVTVCDENVTLSEAETETKTEEKKESVSKQTAQTTHAIALPTDAQRLMQHHHAHVGKILDGKAQGSAIKKLLDANFSVEDLIGCYNFQASEKWRSGVSWLTVASGSTGVGQWIAKGRIKTEQEKTNGKKGNADIIAEYQEYFGDNATTSNDGNEDYQQIESHTGVEYDVAP